MVVSDGSELLLAADDAVARDYVAQGDDVVVVIVGDDLEVTEAVRQSRRVVVAGFTETPARLRRALDLAFSFTTPGGEVLLGSVVTPHDVDAASWRDAFDGLRALPVDDLNGGVRIVETSTPGTGAGLVLLGVVLGMDAAGPRSAVAPSPVAAAVAVTSPAAVDADAVHHAARPAPVVPAPRHGRPAISRLRVVVAGLAVMGCVVAVVLAEAFGRGFFAVAATVTAMAVVAQAVRSEQRGRRLHTRVVALERSTDRQNAKLGRLVERLRPRTLNRSVDEIRSELTHVRSTLGVNRLELLELHRTLTRVQADLRARDEHDRQGSGR